MVDRRTTGFSFQQTVNLASISKQRLERLFSVWTKKHWNP